MTAMNTGDAVEVVARDQTPADIKSGLYYAHFAGMRGTILKLYGEEASVLVARESLQAEVRTRHAESEKSMRQRWLDGLSEEGRGRLSQREKDFTLNYAILVSIKDLSLAADMSSTSASEEDVDLTTQRITASDLDAAEAAFIHHVTAAASKKP